MAFSTTVYSAFAHAHSGNAYCGLGLQSSTSQDIAPAAIWSAEPNQQYVVEPKQTYYISTGDYEEGNILDVEQLGSIATIDFTAKATPNAQVMFTEDMTFDVRYQG